NQLLEVQKALAARQLEKLDGSSLGTGIQYAIKNRADEENPARIQQPHQRHQRHRNEKLPPVRKNVAQQAGDWTGLCRRFCTLRARHCGDCHARLNSTVIPYFGLSRCATFTLYPAFRSRLLTSSAIITERCCPPVHPKLIVR